KAVETQSRTATRASGMRAGKCRQTARSRTTNPILAGALAAPEKIDILGAMPSTRRVFVTGATGFVGRGVIPGLRAEGYAVRCLVRRGSGHDLRGLEAIERVEGNVLARETLERGMAGCDTVIHLVGIIREQGATLTPFKPRHNAGTINRPQHP